jgi:hypothetical protein
VAGIEAVRRVLPSLRCSAGCGRLGVIDTARPHPAKVFAGDQAHRKFSTKRGSGRRSLGRDAAPPPIPWRSLAAIFHKSGYTNRTKKAPHVSAALQFDTQADDTIGGGLGRIGYAPMTMDDAKAIRALAEEASRRYYAGDLDGGDLGASTS